MPHRQLLEFKCDTCGQKHQVDVTDNQDVDDATWPMGWVVAQVQIIGIEENDEKVFCPTHARALAKALGYSDLSTMSAALEAVAEAKASAEEMQIVRLLRDELGDDEEFIITDDDEN